MIKRGVRVSSDRVFLKSWRVRAFGAAVLAAIICPTSDPVYLAILFSGLWGGVELSCFLMRRMKW